MKKFYLMALCLQGLLGTATTATAQDKLARTINNAAPDWMPPFKLGVTAGLNASNFSHGGYDAKCGFQVGLDAMVDMSSLVADNTFVRTGLLLVRKGAKLEYTESGGAPLDKETKYRPVYLQIPVRFGYGYALAPDCIFFGEAGPYVAVGIGGKTTVTHDNQDTKTDFFDSADRFDLGLGVHAGVIISKHHQFSIGYDCGLLNMNDSYSQNRSLMLSYTYYIK